MSQSSLRGQKRAQLVDRVGFVWSLVGSVALYAGEAERDTARVSRRGLDTVQRDLDHELGTDEHGYPPPLGLAFEQRFGLPLQELVGEALETLSDHHELARRGMPCSKVKVREPAVTASVAPLCGEHHQVVGAHRLDLAPGFAASTGRIVRCGVFHDDTLVACTERLVQDALSLVRIGSEHGGDLQLWGD